MRISPVLHFFIIEKALTLKFTKAFFQCSMYYARVSKRFFFVGRNFLATKQMFASFSFLLCRPDECTLMDTQKMLSFADGYGRLLKVEVQTSKVIGKRHGAYPVLVLFFRKILSAQRVRKLYVFGDRLCISTGNTNAGLAFALEDNLPNQPLTGGMTC